MFGVQPIDRLVPDPGADYGLDATDQARLRVLAAVRGAGIATTTDIVPSLRVCAIGAAVLWATIFAALACM